MGGMEENQPWPADPFGRNGMFPGKGKTQCLWLYRNHDPTSREGDPRGNLKGAGQLSQGGGA